MLTVTKSDRTPILLILIVAVMEVAHARSAARKPNIPENFASNMFVNLTIPNLTKIYNSRLWRRYSEGKQLSSGQDITEDKEIYHVSLVREDLKIEYDWVYKSNDISSCKETPLKGNELYAMWEWLEKAVFIKQENTVRYGTVDIWGLCQTQAVDTSLLIELAVKQTAVNVPLYMKMYPGPGYFYEFVYSEFDSQVDESVFNVPTACRKEYIV